MQENNTEQQALDAMRAETMGPLTEANQVAHNELQAEVDANAPTVEATAQEVGPRLTTRAVYVEQDGVIMRVDDRNAMAKAGQDMSVHSSAGRRS